MMKLLPSFLALSSLSYLLLIFNPAQAELDLSLPDYNLPDLGGASVASISYAKERRIGLNVIREIRATEPIIEDPEVSAWIRALGHRLLSHVPHSKNPFYFLVSNDISVNAFATLGGVIVVNSGLILKTESESELAAVIAHEIAHITQHHAVRMMEQSGRDLLGVGMVALAGIIASQRSSDAGQALITGAVALQAHKALSYSREAEAEADRVGLRILTASGFNPKGMLSFWQKLDNLSGTQGNDNEFLQSHPLTINRMSEARLSLLKQRPFNVKKINNSYLYFREKIRVLTKAGSTRSTTVQKIPASVQSYAKATLLLQQGHATAVLKLMGTRSRHKIDAILIAKALLMQHKYTEAVQLLTPLIRLYPGEDALVLPLVSAYLGLKKPKRAWQLINQVRLSEQSSLRFFEVRQTVAHQLGSKQGVFRSMAERSIRLGAYKNALYQLQQAIKSTNISAAELRVLHLLLRKTKGDKKKSKVDR
ncbi:MAG: M48 family metalloprotease [Cocleimonas sp.]|nr:M48 family metalloprotease [Cocleimonas sp.]